MSAREELLALARRHMWAAWQLSSEELASQAAVTLMGLGMLVPEGGASELEELRAERAARRDEVSAAVGYTPGLKWPDLVGIVAANTASAVQAERDVRALRKRVAELETDLAAKAQDHAAAVAGWGRARDRVAELEAERAHNTAPGPNAEKPATAPTALRAEDTTDLLTLAPAQHATADLDPTGDTILLEMTATREQWSAWQTALKVDLARTTNRGGFTTSHATWRGIHVVISRWHAAEAGAE